MLRVRLSRALSRRVLRSEAMICAEASWHAHWSVPWIDAVFWLIRRERGHCAASARWEARQERETTLLDEWRGEGWL